LDTCTAAALWLALNHPFGSETVRRHVSSSLRELDRAHITLSSDARHMWGVTVSEKPVEPQVVMAAFPPGTNVGSVANFRRAAGWYMIRPLGLRGR
jgi:hypothetical protein